jgi:hypothetical protein
MRLPRIFVNLQRYGELAHVDKNWRALCRQFQAPAAVALVCGAQMALKVFMTSA